MDQPRALDAMDAVSAAQYDAFVDFVTDARHDWHYTKAMCASLAAQAVPERKFTTSVRGPAALVMSQYTL